MAQVLRKTSALYAALSVAACASTSTSSSVVIPVDPELAVTRFMSAVEAEDLVAMGQLWGTKDGPAVDRMDAAELDMRLTVMQRYLTHDQYQIQPGGATVRSEDGTRSYQVRITRAGCVHLVPFELVRVGGGWLVSNIDLNEAGNPSRRCGGGRGTLDSPQALIIP